MCTVTAHLYLFKIVSPKEIIVGIDALPFGEWCNVTVAAVAAVTGAVAFKF